MVVKPHRLVSVLTLLFAGTFAVAVIALTVVLRLGVEARFQTYLDASQAATHGRIMGALEGLHDPDGTWDRNRVADLGRQALAEGLVLAVKDADGRSVWDARADDPKAVDRVFATLEARLQARNPWEKGRWVASEHPADTEHGAGGTMVLEVFEPRRLGPSDLAFLQGVDVLWGTVALVGLVASALLGMATARGLVRPLQNLQRTTRRLTEGDLSSPGTPRGPYFEIRELEADLGVLARRLARLQELRDTAGADTAHELRTPLANLEAQLEALEDGVLDPSRERFATLLAESRRMKALVQAWEDLERARAGNTIPGVCFDPAVVVRNVVETFRVRAEAEGQALTVEVRSVPPLPVTDTDLGRITVNLVENAHRFAPGGRLKVSLTKDVRTVVLMVDDNGPGIPVEHRDAVFDRFYRVDPSRARASGGLGLGLSLVKALVEAAGGSVRADVSPEGGCRIIVTFHID